MSKLFEDVTDASSAEKINNNLMYRIRLELYMMNEMTGSYFPDDYGTTLTEATGQLVEMPAGPKTPKEFRDYNICIDYWINQLERSSINPEYYTYLKSLVTISDHHFGTEVEREYPEFREYRQIMLAQADIMACLDSIYIKHPGEPNQWPVTTYDSAARKFEKQTLSILKFKHINGFQKGKLLNRMAVIYAKEAEFLKKIGQNSSEQSKKAKQYLPQALSYLSWYKFRTPLYLATVQLNYAQVLVKDTADKSYKSNLRKAESLLQNVHEAATKCRSYTLEESVLQTLSETHSRLAMLTGNTEMHCLAIKEWSDAGRTNPRISFSLNEDPTLGDIMVRFYNSARKDIFEKCLKENEYDPEAVYEGLGSRLQKK